MHEKTTGFSYIDYCCLVNHDLTDKLNLKLQRLVNCAIRFIFDLRRDEQMTPYRHQLNWLSVKNRRQYFLGIFMYWIRYLEVASYLSELFVPQDSDLRCSSRLPSSKYFSIPLHRTVAYRNSFKLSAIYFWHSFPLHITTASSLDCFKRLLFSYLLALEVNEYWGCGVDWLAGYSWLFLLIIFPIFSFFLFLFCFLFHLILL